VACSLLIEARGTDVVRDDLAEVDPSDRRSPEETARLRDELLARLMRMPPKLQKEMKLGKPRRGKPRKVDRSPDRASLLRDDKEPADATDS
jgi:hypothetical protein